MKDDRASRPSTPVARWAGSSSAPVARTLNGTLRSARVERQRHHGRQHRNRPRLDQSPPTQPHPMMLRTPVDHTASEAFGLYHGEATLVWSGRAPDLTVRFAV